MNTLNQYLIFAESTGSVWLPSQSSTVAGEVDGVFSLILWISMIFFTGIVGALVWFVVRYRRQPGVPAQREIHHSTVL